MRPSRFAPALVVAAAAVARPAPDALAFSACADLVGVAPATTVTLPPRARVIYAFASKRGGAAVAADKITATIDGTAVKTTVSHLKSAPYDLTVIQIDSDRTGKLVVGDATYTVSAAVAMPTDLGATIARYHHRIMHSTVREVWDGLALQLPVGTPAITAHVKIRRDDKAAWSELDVPITAAADKAGTPEIELGELGCVSNYSVPLLEAGVDLDVTVTLVDGSTRKLSGVPLHVALPPP